MTTDRKKSSNVHLAAGSLSGLLSCTLLQPLDLIKTRMQQQQETTGKETTLSKSKIARPSLYSTARYPTNNTFKSLIIQDLIIYSLLYIDKLFNLMVSLASGKAHYRRFCGMFLDLVSISIPFII